MLKIENLSFSYGKSEPVLKDVSLQLETGEIGIVLGRNGSGKSTLFKNILGLCKPAGGKIMLDDDDLTSMPVNLRARRIAYVPQDISFGNLSVFDTVLSGRLSYFNLSPSDNDMEIVERILRETELDGLSGKDATKLSGGEKQKLAIARALAQEPELMIFDEPTGNLDLLNEQLIINEALRLSREKNMAVLCSLHDLNRALTFGEKFFFLIDGAVKYEGDNKVITAEVISDVYGVKAEIVEAAGRKIILT